MVRDVAQLLERCKQATAMDHACQELRYRLEASSGKDGACVRRAAGSL